jgi:hypothetical protein
MSERLTDNSRHQLRPHGGKWGRAGLPDRRETVSKARSTNLPCFCPLYDVFVIL